MSLEVQNEDGTQLECEFGLDRQGGRRFRLNGEIIEQRSELVGKLATVFFNPDSIQLVRGGPRIRRQFVDQGQAELDPLYLNSLTAFNRTLKQKNGLLRDMKRGLVNGRRGREELAAWNRELANHAAVICLGREEYARLISPESYRCHRELTENEGIFELVYQPSLQTAQNRLSEREKKQCSKVELEGEIRKEFDYIMEDEIQRGRPLIGPQLDDFEVRLTSLDLRVFGSQGETRTAAVSLILARGDVLFHKRKIRPVLFFDDIFSELDRPRARRLQEMASRLHQVFIATARQDDVQGWNPPLLKVWQVSSGRIIETTQKP